MKLTIAQAKELAYDDLDEFKDVFEFVRKKEDGKAGRWDISYNIIFKHLETGKFYMFEHTQGATESQDYDMFDCMNYDETIECSEVELKEVLVKKWVEVKGE